MSRSRGNSLKYQIYRSESLKDAFESAQGRPSLIEAGVDTSQIRFEPITEKAIEASYLWGDGASLFPWEDVSEWKSEDYRAFDISLWFGVELCGMAYATPKQSKLCIKVILLEGKPDRTHPLKGFVAPLVLEAILNYGSLLGCSEIEIEDPATAAVPWYQTLGFRYDATNRLVMAIEQ
ncbi:N-acetyltransferase [Pseudomonas syringae]|nr:N-acetyltransferase [Pseudomonas syringae]MCF5382010.1 N-acetyltransferase [Pseudomonas syringae]MCF5419457.1 N-acetyltransferase [Pseudomonas syringae]MCF5452003.1 N-acetyltransferase [Pseudomonas syringae]MCF5456290.1 N-acetyltransferase [Pseudomonas syringae]